ncbi:transcriptional regulator, LacI family [Tindallia magadiensis]|uniref:Transcriptional regulator, LacI family n=1 Tax=Tindallia magadiensis TaxID=69895 RepID=A0A1I3AY98_9FIRM|nr:transcriptional regulator, LacI family [Tindallia magadiensis]
MDEEVEERGSLVKFNIKDVAQKAGVSISTVSRVINSSKPVKQKTKDKVLDAIEELGYRPNAIARSLKVKHTKSIGIMTPDIANQFYPEVVRGIEDVANMYEYSIFLCNTDLNEEKELQYFAELEEKQIDGLIFLGNHVSKELRNEMESADIPVVLIGGKATGIPSVTINNEKAAKDAVDFLLNRNHRRIGIITGKMKDPMMGQARLKGYQKALEEKGIEVKEELVIEGGYRYKSGYDGAKRLMALKVPPTAIFVCSDEMAIGACRAILEDGHEIPKDVAIVGFDNVDISGKVYPSLSTIGQPMYEMGAIAMRLLTKILHNESIGASDIVLDYEVIEREST